MLPMRITLLVVALVIVVECDDVPVCTIRPLYPKGFEVSIPDEPGQISLFAFHGKIKNHADIAVDINQTENGRWVYRNNDILLTPGDTLNYWLTVRRPDHDHHAFNQTYIVPAPEIHVPSPQGFQVSTTITEDLHPQIVPIIMPVIAIAPNPALPPLGVQMPMPQPGYATATQNYGYHPHPHYGNFRHF